MFWKVAKNRARIICFDVKENSIFPASKNAIYKPRLIEKHLLEISHFFLEFWLVCTVIVK